MVKVFDSQCELFKTPIGPLKEQEHLQLAINLSEYENVSEVVCILTKKGWHELTLYIDMEPSRKHDGWFETTITQLEICLYEYSFKFVSNDEEYFIRKKHGSFVGQICKGYEYDSWHLTVYKPITTHPIMHSGIMYQIFPDRFALTPGTENDNLPKDRIYRKWGEEPYSEEGQVAKDFFKGSFKGIQSKIPYLQSLFVNAVYCNPIWLSSSNHRYDAIDYTKVDPVLGTFEDFQTMINSLHQNGMIFIMDAVLNHVGWDSIYFDKDNIYGQDGAFTSVDSKRRDWFYFDLKDPTKYECWWNVKSMPKLNYSSHSLVTEIFGEEGVIATWYGYGIDGLRLDVADELPNEILRDIFNLSQLKKGDDKIIIPEVWEDASCKWAYEHFMQYMLGEQVTSVMNYPIRDTLLPYVRYGNVWADNFRTTCEEIFLENYPREIAYSLMNFLSTHDTVRAITKLAGPETDDHDRKWQREHNTLSPEEYQIGRERLKVAYTILFMLPGIPSIYYGDEIGMSGMKDPFNRACMNWDDPDKELLQFFQGLCYFRSNNKDHLAEASFKIVTCEDRYLVLDRTMNGKTLRLISNTSKFEIDVKNEFYKGKEVFKSNLKNGEKLMPRSCMILELTG